MLNELQKNTIHSVCDQRLKIVSPYIFEYFDILWILC